MHRSTPPNLGPFQLHDTAAILIWDPSLRLPQEMKENPQLMKEAAAMVIYKKLKLNPTYQDTFKVKLVLSPQTIRNQCR